MSERERYIEMLSAYLDGELGEPEKTQLTRALESDAELKGELEHLRKVREVLRQVPRARAPEGFVAQVMEQAAKTHLVAPHAGVTQPRSLRWIRNLATAAVLVVAVGTVALIVNTLSSPTIEDQYAVADRKKPDTEDGMLKKLSDIRSAGTEPVKGGGAATLTSAPPAMRPEMDKLTLARADIDEDLTHAINIEIDAEDLNVARQQVETALFTNSIIPVKPDTPITEQLGRTNQPQENVYQVNIDTSSQVQYVAMVRGGQMKQLQRDLDSVRQQQRALRKPETSGRTEQVLEAAEEARLARPTMIPAEPTPTRTYGIGSGGRGYKGSVDTHPLRQLAKGEEIIQERTAQDKPEIEITNGIVAAKKNRGIMEGERALKVRARAGARARNETVKRDRREAESSKELEESSFRFDSQTQDPPASKSTATSLPAELALGKAPLKPKPSPESRIVFWGATRPLATTKATTRPVSLEIARPQVQAVLITLNQRAPLSRRKPAKPLQTLPTSRPQTAPATQAPEAETESSIDRSER